MASTQLISLDRVFSGLYRDLKPAMELSEADLIEWAAEALEFIGAYPQFEEAVETLQVKQYKVLIPCGLHKILQIGLKVSEGAPSGCPIYVDKFGNPPDCEKHPNDPCECPPTVPCNESGLVFADGACTDKSTIALAELWTEYYGNPFTTTSAYHNEWVPIRLATGSFRDADMHSSGCANLKSQSKMTYKIDNPYIKTNFKEGHICIAFIRQPLDDKGWPMIPDTVHYVEAIKKYLVYKIKYSEFLQGAIHPNIYEKLEQDWHLYCRQARNTMLMPSTIDEMENLKDSWKRLIPQEKRYYGFFGNLSSPENLSFYQSRRRAIW
jgi:hypothetical protein